MKSCFLIFCTILFEISSENVQQQISEEMDIENDYKDELGHKRYARHVQMATETPIHHILEEVKRKFHSNANKGEYHNQLSKVAQGITNKFKHLRKKKLDLEKKDKVRRQRKSKGGKNVNKLKNKLKKVVHYPTTKKYNNHHTTPIPRGTMKQTVHRFPLSSKKETGNTAHHTTH